MNTYQDRIVDYRANGVFENLSIYETENIEDEDIESLVYDYDN